MVSSPRTSQSSQYSNSMRSPTTDVASNQSSQLAHPSYFSNPALMDGSNLQSLHVDTYLLPTPTRGRRWSRQPSPSLPSPPSSSTPHQRPRTHTYTSHFLSTLTIAPSPWPALLLCNNEFSINPKFNTPSFLKKKPDRWLVFSIQHDNGRLQPNVRKKTEEYLETQWISMEKMRNFLFK